MRMRHALWSMVFAIYFLLQLEQVRAEVFVIPPESLALSQRLLDRAAPEAAEPVTASLTRLVRGASHISFQPCVKGRFFDAMQSKLEQLDRSRSNEVTAVDFGKLAAQILTEASDAPP